MFLGMDEVPPHDMQTIRITGMTPSFAKRVSSAFLQLWKLTYLSSYGVPVVCVSSLLISEIKRIIKESEIMKCEGEVS